MQMLQPMAYTFTPTVSPTVSPTDSHPVQSICANNAKQIGYSNPQTTYAPPAPLHSSTRVKVLGMGSQFMRWPRR